MKKGDLSLSTNAIVVLIMALVVLGLAIGFTQGMFSDLRSKLSGYDKEPNAPTASAANPLTTSKQGDFAVSKGEEVVMKISVYNSYEDDWEDTNAELNCGDNNLEFSSESLKAVFAGSPEEMILVFDAPSSSGIKICTLDVENSGNESQSQSIEFVMTVE
jgi:hypothetical protein